MHILPLIGLSLWLGAATIHWQGDAVEVRGVPDAASLDRRKLAERFVVTVDGQDTAVAGSYDAGGDVIHFRFRFPMQPGLKYRAVWKEAGQSEVAAVFALPKKHIIPSTRVAELYPTAAVLPSNQLKLYLHFSASMSRGEAWRRIHLIDDQGKEVQLPFLEIEEELWDREAKRLTVLFDPGRIKRGLVPHNEVGPALVEGRSYQIVVDREWPDAKGAPLVEKFTKSFRVTDADRTPPTLANWKVSAPTGPPGALAVEFPEPLDSALLQRLMWVEDASGKNVEGNIALTQQETRWAFTPGEPWKPGAYTLKVGAVLEDLAGNRIDRRFDVDTFERVEMRITTATRSIPFTVSPSAAPK